MVRSFSDAVLTDSGASLRRVGSALMVAGTLILSAAIMVFFFASPAWTFAGPSAMATLTGIASLVVGWKLLRRGDALGPRCTSFRWWMSPTPEPIPVRVYVRNQPYGALPRGRR